MFLLFILLNTIINIIPHIANYVNRLYEKTTEKLYEKTTEKI